jgi:hypothetical protein
MIMHHYALYIYICSICFCLFLSWILAQEILDIAVDSSKFAIQSQQLQDINVDFCATPGIKSVDYTISLWEIAPICLQLSNKSDTDVTVNLWFVDGTVTNDERQNPACGLDSDIVFFGQYVSGYNNNILLQKQTTQIQYAYISYPKDTSIIPWDIIQWCLVYALVHDNDTEDMWFDILVRRAKFITIHIEKKSINYRYFSIILIIGLLIIIQFRKIFSNKWK